jgi:hypothetical protein
MALPGNVQAAPDGAIGFDADSRISVSVAQEFVSQGYSFCVRYLSRGIGQAPGDLSAAEASAILAAGLGLMAVQHVRLNVWAPNAAMGQSDGTNAAGNAAAIGFPPGVNIWCDLEEVTGAEPADVIGYCSAWFEAVAAGGFVPGLYVGSNCVLDGQQLYDLPFQHYWKSISAVPPMPSRGYQMTQTVVTGTVNGIGIDRNVAQTDGEGGQALWLVAGSA